MSEGDRKDDGCESGGHRDGPYDSPSSGTDRSKDGRVADGLTTYGRFEDGLDPSRNLRRDPVRRENKDLRSGESSPRPKDVTRRRRKFT